ncbi:MAG: hypothetical protein WCH46_04740 [bacterium]
MDRYLIISPHSADDCTAVVKQVIAAGFNSHVDWGCKDDEHTAWAILEADSHEQAMMFVPPIMRPKARAVKLVKFGQLRDSDPH